MSVDQFEEAKEENQKLKYSNEQTSESWQKVEATAMGISPQKIESRVKKGALIIVHVLSAWLPSSPDVLFSNISAKEFPSNLS